MAAGFSEEQLSAVVKYYEEESPVTRQGLVAYWPLVGGALEPAITATEGNVRGPSAGLAEVNNCTWVQSDSPLLIAKSTKQDAASSLHSSSRLCGVSSQTTVLWWLPRWRQRMRTGA